MFKVLNISFIAFLLFLPHLACANSEHVKIFEEELQSHGFEMPSIEVLSDDEHSKKVTFSIRDFKHGLLTGKKKEIIYYNMAQIGYLLTLADRHNKSVTANNDKVFSLLEIVCALDDHAKLTYECSLIDSYTKEQQKTLGAMSLVYAETAKRISGNAIKNIRSDKCFWSGVQASLVVGTCLWVKWMLSGY